MRNWVVGVLLLSFTALFEIGCGKGGNTLELPLNQSTTFTDSSDYQDKNQLELQPVNSSSGQSALNLSAPKNIVVDPQTGEMNLTVDVNSNPVSLTGKLDKTSGMAHLSNQGSDAEAFAACLDLGKCSQFVVTLYEKGSDGQITQQQFLTPSLETEDFQASTSGSTPSDSVSAATKSIVDPNQFSVPSDSAQIQSTPGEDDSENDESLGSAGFVAPSTTLDTNKKPSVQDTYVTNRSEAAGPHATEMASNGRRIYGGLYNAMMVPQEGPGFQRKETSSTAGVWGTQTIVNLISQMSAALAQTFADRPPLVIGPVSLKKGGLFRGHLSHQNGLDADIGYPLLSPVSGNNWPRLVTGKKVDSNFDSERFWYLLKYLAHTGEVPIIFVDQQIKNTMCAYARSLNEFPNDVEQDTFKALLSRPNSSHQNHFHMRVQCASWMNRCEKVKPPDPRVGTGCPQQNN